MEQNVHQTNDVLSVDFFRILQWKVEIRPNSQSRMSIYDVVPMNEINQRWPPT